MMMTFIHRRRLLRENLAGRLARLIRVAAVAVTGTCGMLGMLGTLGCAKSPTVIMTEVSADSTVPELLKLAYTVTRASDPGHPATGALVSQGVGDAGDGRAPYVFPLRIAVGPLFGWSGPVEITVNGKEWLTDAIVATGKTSAQAVAEQQSEAAVTLTAVSRPGDPDAGTAGDAASDTAVDAGD